MIPGSSGCSVLKQNKATIPGIPKWGKEVFSAGKIILLGSGLPLWKLYSMGAFQLALCTNLPHRQYLKLLPMCQFISCRPLPFFFWGKLLQCIPNWPRTHYVDQAGLEPRKTHHLPYCPSAGIKGIYHHTQPGHFKKYLNFKKNYHFVYICIFCVWG